MTDRLGPLPFCPGCGHHLLTKALDRALVKLQLDPKKVVIVTDIGCIGLADRYFNTNAFHGLHGRSITYASGLKLARPELTVITLQGDGGCGIGGTHLINVARRNIGITLIIGNNFNYGMTGGQHSVTTPECGLTTTTPWGNVEVPLDVCKTAIAAGGCWVYRTTAFDGELADIMAEAIEQPGFALLDVWELCTAYYSPRNKFKKKDLQALIEMNGFETGLLANNPRPEYSANYRQLLESYSGTILKKKVIEKKHTNSVTRQTGIIIAGSAGQRIKSSATLLAEAAMFSGLEATQKNDYPITVMTGHSISEIIVSPDQIEYTAIDSPDYFVVLSEDGLRRSLSRFETLPETCTLFLDNSLEFPETRAQVVALPILEESRKISKQSAAVMAIAAMLRHSGMFPVHALEDAISEFQEPGIAATSLVALQAGRRLMETEVEQGENPELLDI